MRSVSLLIIGLLFSATKAQVGVSGIIQTDTVSLLVESATISSHQSVAALYGASAIIPGAGQLIGGRPEKAFVFFAVEAALVAGAVFTLRQSDETYNDARSFARSAARTSSNKSDKDSYWTSIGTYQSSKGWNADMERMELNGDEYNALSDQWAWDSDASMSHYRRLRSDAEGYRIAGSFLLGGLLLDRFFSMLDLRIGLRRGTISALPSFNPATGSAGLELSAGF